MILQQIQVQSDLIYSLKHATKSTKVDNYLFYALFSNARNMVCQLRFGFIVVVSESKNVCITVMCS